MSSVGEMLVTELDVRPGSLSEGTDLGWGGDVKP